MLAVHHPDVWQNCGSVYGGQIVNMATCRLEAFGHDPRMTSLPFELFSVRLGQDTFAALFLRPHQGRN